MACKTWGLEGHQTRKEWAQEWASPDLRREAANEVKKGEYGQSVQEKQIQKASKCWLTSSKCFI